jgi:hypothetical protein
VIFSFNNKMLQGNRFGSAAQPKLQYCVHLARIMVATLLVCLVVGSRGEVTQREIQPWTEIASALSDSNLRYLLSQVSSPFGSDYITLRRPTSGPDGIYVANRLAKLISGWGGTFRDAFRGDASSKPDTIAVSRDNIALISDDFNNTIGFHRRLGAIGNNPVLADKIADSRIATGSFNTIGLTAVDSQLRVTDSMNPPGRSC